MRAHADIQQLLQTIGKQQVAVAELEAVGLPLRIINMLERNLRIIWIEDLLQYTPQQLKENVPYLGDGGVALIIDSVCCLDDIGRAQQHLPERFNVGSIPSHRDEDGDEESTAG